MEEASTSEMAFLDKQLAAPGPVKSQAASPRETLVSENLVDSDI